MACPVCIQAFDLREVRPKALPCGHTVCQSCVGRLQQQCPTCRAAFEMPRPDNFVLVELLEALQLEGPSGSWWCMDCNTTAGVQCVVEHERTRPKKALRLVLQDLMPRATQDGLRGLQHDAALTALQLLRDPPATCKLTLGKDDGEAFGAEWRVDGQGAEDSLAQTLAVMALAASGRLVQEPRGVHADAPPAAQQPVDNRIPELDLGALSCSGPGLLRGQKDEKLGLVRQQGVRRIIQLYCHNDPDWALDVLRSAAPTLEELEVKYAMDTHVDAVHDMPRLQRLYLGAHSSLRPVELPALPRPSCLKWLRVQGLPRATTVSLLRAHAASLDVLWLQVDSEPGGEWPRGCDDLDTMLGQCELRLTRLVLWRCLRPHGEGVCRAQLEAARRCTVACILCDDVTFEAF